MKIRAKTFKGWLKYHFTKTNLQDIARHGANGGWHGLIYYCDIVKLYAKFKQEIWEYLSEQSESAGYNNPFEFIATFNGAKGVDNDVTMETLVVHYMAESLAYEITEGLD